jgi:outer membrane cobalamin receptor
MDFEQFNGFAKAIDFKSGQEVVSQYIDYQSRLTNNLYATVGIRFDDHSQAGTEDSERISLAYLFDDKNTKLKTSYGTGIKYPSLYEFYINANSSSLVAEHGRSYDIGLEKSFPEQRLNFDITYFNHKYVDMIEGQKEPAINSKMFLEQLDQKELNLSLNLNLIML